MSKYSVCIIGCGDIGFNFDEGKKGKGALTHFKAFNKDKRFNLIGVAELNHKTRRTIGDKYKVKAYENYKQMLGDCKPDVVVIAADDESHFEMLKEAVKHDPKIVFCEKPMSGDLKKATEINSVYKKNRIPLQINYTRRFLNEFYDTEKFIKGEAFGKLESATFYYSRGLIHNASHYLDLVNWYIGETEKNLIKVSLKAGMGKTDQTVSFDMTFRNNLEVRFIGLMPSKLSFAEVDFIGSNGRLKINYKNEIEKYKVVKNKMFTGYSMYEMTSSKPVQFSEALPNAADNIYNFLEGKEKLKSPSDNSIKIFELIERIKRKPLCQN